MPGFESAAPAERMAGRHLAGAQVAETWGLTLLRGRDLAASDIAAARAALVNEAFARHFFGTIDVVGRELTFAGQGDRSRSHTVVGVVANARERGLKRPIDRVAYTLLTPTDLDTVSFALRLQGATDALLASIRAEARAVDPLVPVLNVQTMDARFAQALRSERLLALLGTLFGVLALLLAAIGLYGLLSGAVAQRRREIGIRLALGEPTSCVLWLVLRRGLTLTMVGLGVGLGLGLWLTRFVRGELFGVSHSDPFTLGATVVVLSVTGAMASLLPAIRAARTDPIVALRAE
jgi:hypothetical protein